MATFYDSLFTVCGYEPQELKEERPRIEETLRRLVLTSDDMKIAEDSVRKNFDVQLNGVRKILSIWLKELTDLVLAKDDGKKVFYYGFPSIGGLGMAIASASENVYCGAPGVILCHTMGQIFDKLHKILEAGEGSGLPAGHSLCTLQTTRAGALAKGIIPIPDLVAVSSYYCDMGSKTDELLGEKYGYASVVIDGSMDSKWGEFPEYDPVRVSYLGGQINKLFDEVEKRLGVGVTEEEFQKGVGLSFGFMKSMGQLGGLMNADPVPISMVDVSLARFLGTASTLRAMNEVPKAIDIMVPEVEKRISEGSGVVPKGSPRVLLGFPSFSDPTFIHMIEACGLAVSNQVLMSPLRVKSWVSDRPTLGEQRAEIEMRVGFYHSNYGIVRRWAEVAEDLNVDGFIWNYPFNCRPIASTSHLVKKYVEDNEEWNCLN